MEERIVRIDARPDDGVGGCDDGVGGEGDVFVVDYEVWNMVVRCLLR